MHDGVSTGTTPLYLPLVASVPIEYHTRGLRVK